MTQKYSSKNTSINSTKIPAVFHKVVWKLGDRNLDYGGGRFDSAEKYLKSVGAENFVYDPYNRSDEHNNTVRGLSGTFTSATISNVLNVIKEKSARAELMSDLNSLLKKGTPIYITVYEGDKSGIGKETKNDCWQNNLKYKEYLTEVKSCFDNVYITKSMIVAHSR